jgi:uncharacterized protein
VLGQRVKLAGYVVPIEIDDAGQLTEFLFVPYFGACLHMPAPPRNQIIFGKLSQPMPEVNMFEAYWLEGTLAANTYEGELATSSYEMQQPQLTIWD